MRPVLVLSKFAVMAAIVATLTYVPLCLMAALGFRLLGGSIEGILTFGGALHVVLGVLAWWVIFFAAACAYAAWMYPWDDPGAATETNRR
jgi:hypothetical protein